MQNCDIRITDNYSIELVQGDYASYIFNITDENNVALQNVNEIYFTCKRLKTKITLITQDNLNYALIIPSTLTSAFDVCTTSYDVTATFTGNATPYTVIYNAKITVLKKDNLLSV